MHTCCFGYQQLGCKSQKNWDYRLFPKEDMETLWLQKQDAAAKRECMKKFSYSHRVISFKQILAFYLVFHHNFYF